MSSIFRLSRRAWVAVVLALVCVVGLGVWSAQQAATAAAPAAGSDAIVCPLVAKPFPTVTVTIPRCPPPCPRVDAPTSGAAPDLLIRCCPPFTAMPADPSITIKCPPPPTTVPTTTVPSTTVPSTIPIDGWAIAGVTENRTCAGPSTPEGCQRPFIPASDQVTISQRGHVVATTKSDGKGQFRIPVGPGVYTAQASVTVRGAVGVDCPAQTVTVAGPPVPVVITLTCTIQLP